MIRVKSKHKVYFEYKYLHCVEFVYKIYLFVVHMNNPNGRQYTVCYKGTVLVTFLAKKSCNQWGLLQLFHHLLCRRERC